MTAHLRRESNRWAYESELVQSIPRIAELIAGADALLITAGAGMSVDSGLPDYRGTKGFWRAYPPLEKLGIPFERMAQPHWFATKPEMAWAWYGHRQQLYRATTPHAGHRLLLDWAQSRPAGAFVVTSNVDGQFVTAGFPAASVVEQHGNIHRYQCTAPCSNATWECDPPELEIDLSVLHARGELPRCPACGALARPNVLMFNDFAWVSEVTRRQQSRYADWLSAVRRRRLVILELGAGTAVPTIRRIGEKLAAELSRATLVRINPEASEADEPALPLRLPALEALTRIEAVRLGRAWKPTSPPSATSFRCRRSTASRCPGTR